MNSVARLTTEDRRRFWLSLHDARFHGIEALRTRLAELARLGVLVVVAGGRRVRP